MSRTDVSTPLGIVPLWHLPEAAHADRPVLVTIAPAFADDEYMTRLPQVLGSAADTFLMHMPGNHAPPLTGASVTLFAKALEEVLAKTFSGRPVVLFGLGVGAVVAMAVRSPVVRRVVAVEPLLSMAKLWPLIPNLQRSATTEANNAAYVAFLKGVYGVSAQGVEDLRHHRLVEGLQAPVDVLLGTEPLDPPRAIQRAPSLVDEADRAFLEALPGVEIHLAPDSGHGLAFQAPIFLRERLLHACRLAARPADLSLLQRTLVSRIPVDAASVAYVGGEPAAFRAAWLARNPNSEFRIGGDGVEPADVLVVEDMARLDVDPGLLDGLAPGGQLVTAAGPRLAAAIGERLAALGGVGLQVNRIQPIAPENETFDDWSQDLTNQWRRGALATRAVKGESLLIIARKGANLASKPLHLRIVAFAPTLMDIRTRLPALGLRSEPELLVTYQKQPFRYPNVPLEQPKIQILQRPVTREGDLWRTAMALNLRHGWIAVLDFDDHPELVSRMNGYPDGPVWLGFSYAHAIQTSTPELAEAFRRVNPEVRIFPNAVFEGAPFRSDLPRRVFYGAVRRGQFGVDVVRSLAPVTKAFPDVEFVVVGDRDVFDALPTAAKRYHEYLPYEDYLDLMGSCSISLTPIEGLPMQETKSDAKFLEASARSVLTVASPTVYKNTIRHNETGLIAERVDDWAPILSRFLENEGERRRIARNAWDYVRRHRMFAHQFAARREWYRELWERRAELNQAVLGRHPDIGEELRRLG